MPKIPTVWTTNTNIGVVDPYDTSGTYDGSGTTAPIDLYDGVAAGQSSITTKIPSVWSRANKTAAQWTTNSASLVGLRPYDSGTVVYDSGSIIYDGNTQSSITTKIATQWSST